MPGTASRPLRKDAERNRERILVAARELFAEHGLTVTLDEIARHAGVGVGTVYRRFPDKELLIDALFEDRLGEIVAVATEATEIDDPWRGLAHFLERALELQAQDRALKELLLSTSDGHARVERGRAVVQPLVLGLLQRAQEAGVVRDDVAVSDLILIQHAAGEVAAYTREVSPEVWRRILVVALDGLRPDRRRPSPMPVPALDDEQVFCSMRSWGEQRRRR
jgi:AcrR family transcriptional regulator